MSIPHPGLEERMATLRRRRVHSSRHPDVREVVRLRAGDACEYCLLPTLGRFHLEHIIPPGLWDRYRAGRLSGVPPQPGRGGPNHIDNYAWSCPFCNEAKGQRVAHGSGAEAVRFFDPRADRWPDHFVFLAGSGYIFIVGATDVGRTTAGPQGLHFNAGGPEGPLGARHITILRGAYPPAWARAAYHL
jgi:hypothetical protein